MSNLEALGLIKNYIKIPHDHKIQGQIIRAVLQIEKVLKEADGKVFTSK